MLQKRFRGLLTRRRYWEDLEAEAAALEQEIAVEQQPPKQGRGSETASQVEAEADIEVGPKKSSSEQQQQQQQQQQNGASSLVQSAATAATGCLESWLEDSAAAAAAAADAPTHAPSEVSVVATSTEVQSLERKDSLHVHTSRDNESASHVVNGDAAKVMHAAEDLVVVQNEHDIAAAKTDSVSSQVDGDGESKGIWSRNDAIGAKLADLQEQLAVLMRGTQSRADSPTVAATSAPSKTTSAPVHTDATLQPPPLPPPAFEDEV
jgi:hypothetical protein